MKTLACLLAAAAILAALPCRGAPVTVTGSVVDFGVAGQPQGLAGVAVTVKDAKSLQVLGATNTHRDGRYSMVVDVTAVSDVMVWFNKLGYVQRNAQRPLTDPSRPQAEVRLLSEDPAPAETAANIAVYARSATGAQFDTLFSAISSLPADKKQRVVAELKLKDAGLSDEFAKSDDTYRAVSDFNERLKGHGQVGAGNGVKVYPNFGAVGTTRISGDVANLDQKRRLEAAVKGLGDSGNVRSDIRINKVEATKAMQLDKLLDGSESDVKAHAKADRIKQQMIKGAGG